MHILTLFLVLWSFGCASKLPNKLEDNKPRGEGITELDLSTVEFDDYDTGDRINLKTYMQQNNKEYLLITFGSKGCGACKEKSGVLTESVIDKHQIYLSPQRESFDIVGVFTDPGGRRAVAQYLVQFPYIRWNDPKSEMLLKLLPKGATFAVPLTVFVTLKEDSEGIVFAVPPDEHASVDEIMARVVEHMGLDAVPTDDGGDSGGDDGGGDGGGDDGGDGGEVIPAAPLELALPGRLQGLGVEDCDGNQSKLDGELGDVTYKVVHVVRSCGESCEQNLKELERVRDKCSKGQFKNSCQVISLTAGPLGAEECSGGFAFKGGSEFFSSAFESLFNWSYQQTEGPPPLYEISIPAVEGPMTFVFSSTGNMVFSHEKTLGKNQLDSTLNAKTETVNVGPNFPVYDGEVQSFAEVRRQNQFTILNLWGAYPSPCGSCVEELKHWSQAGGLVDFCAERPGFCKVYAMEPNLPDPQTAASMTERYRGLLLGNDVFDGFGPLNIRTTLLLDPSPTVIPESYVERFYGYLQALKPEWLSDFRTVIYDREGKIVATYKVTLEGEVDYTFEKVKELAKAMGR
jgi:hypothetical protein